ncbi:MAG TPA: anaerobic ribonucleoside-triphosphate reductase [Candidatus Methylomirabilis sp.]|nr:anaerobic ribonucleoside-triphosphate reductase [Candidatus Methylomirabilis sp.]
MSPTKTKRQECIVYSRVVGWLTPVKNWNKGKKAEFNDRKTFTVDERTYN